MSERKAVIILGSARGDGNTRKVVDRIMLLNSSLHFINLSQKRIEYFDYQFQNQGDDFIPIMEDILEYDTLIFASPVYWYSMSGIMKNFFDRITDLLEIRKDLGKRLNGKSMMSISCGSSAELDNSFSIPFKESAKYLKMHYLGHLHSWIEREELPNQVEHGISVFLAKLDKGSPSTESHS